MCYFSLGGFGGGFFGLGPMMPLLVMGLIAYLLYKVFTTNRHSICHPSIQAGSANGSSLEILNNKFAAGEISEAEYLRKKDLLRQ